jgi:hypothetical protein
MTATNKVAPRSRLAMLPVHPSEALSIYHAALNFWGSNVAAVAAGLAHLLSDGASAIL